MLDRMSQIQNEAQFAREVLDSSMPVAVEFYATWCPHCRRFTPLFAELGRAYEGRVKFAQTDVDAASDLELAYKVERIPTVILFRDGREVKRWINDRDRSSYEQAFDALLPPARKAS